MEYPTPVAHGTLQKGEQKHFKSQGTRMFIVREYLLYLTQRLYLQNLNSVADQKRPDNIGMPMKTEESSQVPPLEE